MGLADAGGVSLPASAGAAKVGEEHVSGSRALANARLKCQIFFMYDNYLYRLEVRI